MARFLHFALGAMLVACGIDAVGTAPRDGSTSDGGPPGNAGGGTLRSDASTTNDGATTSSLPAGWTGATFDAAADAGADAGACELVGEGPSATAGACACTTCNVSQQASCAAGAVALVYGTGATCDTSSTPLGNNPAGTCRTDVPNAGDDFTNVRVRLTAPALTGGACTATETKDATKIAWTKRWVLCASNDAEPTCVVRDGDEACPGEWPTKQIVGDSATWDCGACGCNVSSSCTPTVTVYKDANCTTGPVAITADATCRLPGFSGAYYSYRYVGVATTSCAATGTPAASNVALAGTRTVCCR